MSGTPTPGARDIHEVLFYLFGIGTDTVQAALSVMASSSKAKFEQDGEYDFQSRSFAGDDGLRYRVPLQVLPSGTHSRAKRRNIHVVMENVRRLCISDMLPSTAEERRFWAEFPTLWYKMMAQPFAFIFTCSYTFSRVYQTRFPLYLRGRFIPLAFSLMAAEQWVEHNYPAGELLSVALSRKTPLGDAARAEWQRLQPHTISFYNYATFCSYAFWGDVGSAGLQFGGEILRQ